MRAGQAVPIPEELFRPRQAPFGNLVGIVRSCARRSIPLSAMAIWSTRTGPRYRLSMALKALATARSSSNILGGLPRGKFPHPGCRSARKRTQAGGAPRHRSEGAVARHSYPRLHTPQAIPRKPCSTHRAASGRPTEMLAQAFRRFNEGATKSGEIRPNNGQSRLDRPLALQHQAIEVAHLGDGIIAVCLVQQGTGRPRSPRRRNATCGDTGISPASRAPAVRRAAAAPPPRSSPTISSIRIGLM